jgi:hypothetical protein
MIYTERVICGSGFCPRGAMTALLLLFIIPIYVFPLTHTSESVIKKTGLEKVPIDALATEFRKLRKIKGHFQGGKWNKDTDGWMCRKHRVMIELGRRLVNNSFKLKDILRLLGEPDKIKHKKKDGGETLVYYWRGNHDYLMFTCKDQLIVHSYWWYAFE